MVLIEFSDLFKLFFVEDELFWVWFFSFFIYLLYLSFFLSLFILFIFSVFVSKLRLGFEFWINILV